MALEVIRERFVRYLGVHMISGCVSGWFFAGKGDLVTSEVKLGCADGGGWDLMVGGGCEGMELQVRCGIGCWGLD